MADIAAASDEQLSGIQQVGNAVTQMDRVTQQNAALVGQSAAAAEHMTAQAEQLVNVVARFRLGNVAHEASQVPLAAPVAAEGALPQAELAKSHVLAASRVAGQAIAQIRSSASGTRLRAGVPATAPDEEWKEF
jgi:methyl-accepting chemotaxis protein